MDLQVSCADLYITYGIHEPPTIIDGTLCIGASLSVPVRVYWFEYFGMKRLQRCILFDMRASHGLSSYALLCSSKNIEHVKLIYYVKQAPTEIDRES